MFLFPARKESSTFHFNRKPTTPGDHQEDIREAPVVMKLRNHPTVGIDHWGHGSLVVGLPGVQLSSGVKGRRSSTHCGGYKKRGGGVGRERAVKNRIREARNGVSVSCSAKELKTISELKSRIYSDLGIER
ncbi:hypothetical protein AVEN_274451-1 [Araneus ventricosus]|uniref:Uncharacterized protein n=1 Tax=Araneus ventricosus TaxID=182803 RepID=A0A4Y2F6U5_ARAVE|nr:hypothetical protein AVEN_274451-1 [Araneus ventricosus]